MYISSSVRLENLHMSVYIFVYVLNVYNIERVSWLAALNVNVYLQYTDYMGEYAFYICICICINGLIVSIYVYICAYALSDEEVTREV